MRYNLNNLSPWRTWGVRPAAQGSLSTYIGRPPMRPMFKSRRLREDFSTGRYSCFSLSSKLTLQNSNSARNGWQRTTVWMYYLSFSFSKVWLVIHSPFVPASRYESTLHFERILPKSGNTDLKRHQGLEIRRVQSRISVRLSREVWINYLRCPYARPYGEFQPWAGLFQSSLGHEGIRARSLKGRVAIIHD